MPRTLPSFWCGCALAALIAIGACDLPTTPEEARDRLAEGRDQTVSLTVPFPAAELSVREEIEKGTIDFGDVIDTNDFTIHVEPDPFTVGFDPFQLDVTDIAPILEAFDLNVDPFDVSFSIQVDPVAVDLPTRSFSIALPHALGVHSELLAVDYSDTYGTVALSSGAELRVALNTEGGGTVNTATATLLNQAGITLASSTGSVTLAPGQTGTLVIPIGGHTLLSSLQVRLDLVSAVGDLDPKADAAAVVSFASATVTAATQVLASQVNPVAVSQRVALDQTGSDFTVATLATGTMSLTQFDFGDLTFTQGAAFETDLSGKRVGLTPPDSITVAGTVAAPAGATRVNVSTVGSVAARVSNITLSSATLTTVDFDVARTADVVDEDSGDFKGVSSAEVANGTVTLEMMNRMPVSGTIAITLAGTTDAGGDPLSQSIDITASSDGSPVTQTMSFDLAGTTIVPAQLEASVTGSLGGSGGTVTSEIAADAFRVEASASVTANAVTLADAGADLSSDFETMSEFTKSELGIDDVVDFLKDLSLNDVDLSLTIQNPTEVDLTLDSLVVTLISLPSEQPIPSANGGDITLLVEEGGTGSVVVPGEGSKLVVVDASELVSKLLNELSADRRAGIKASGTGGVGGASGRISVSDELTVGLDVRAPVDLTVPANGAKIDATSHNVVDLSGTAADVVTDLSEALVSAVLDLDVTNPIPVALQLDVAIAPTPAESQRDSFNPFDASPQLVIRGISIAAAPTDTNGRATGSTVQTVSVDIPTNQLPVFEEGEMTLRVNATILPPSSGSRGLITGDEVIVLKPTARLTINIKGQAGGG